MNRKGIILIIILIFVTAFCRAQSVVFEQGIDVIGGVAEIEYYIDNPGVVECRVSADFGNTFSTPLKYVTGDIGTVKKRGNKSMKCDILSEFGELNISLIFRVIYYPSNRRTIFVNYLPVTFIYVDGGSFDMGGTKEQIGANNQERPVHRVTVSGFWMAETETTQELWSLIEDDNPSFELMEEFPDCFVIYAGYAFFYINKSAVKPTEVNYSNTIIGDTFDFPVNSVSFIECLRFIEKLNDYTGLNFRLPTEAEWEFAARGGNKSKGYLFSGSNNLSKVFRNNIRNYPVKENKANELGIYDMTGNVCEFCLDSYREYSEESCINPLVKDESDEIVVRGGLYFSNSHEDSEMRISKRLNFPKDLKSNIVGFRLILE